MVETRKKTSLEKCTKSKSKSSESSETSETTPKNPPKKRGRKKQIFDPNQRFECPFEDCSSTFRNRASRNTHVCSVHSPRIKCPIPNCNRTIKRVSLQKHISCMHEQETTQCERCGRVLRPSSMRQHQRFCNAGEVRRVECPREGCALRFANAYLCNRHLRAFHGEPTDRLPHSKRPGPERGVRAKCANCSKTMMKSSLRDHFERCQNNGERKFPCTVKGCKAKFSTLANRCTHVSFVHRPQIVCPVSGCKQFVKPTSLLGHFRMVHQQLMGQCHRCGKQMKRDSLGHHLRRCKGGRNREATGESDKDGDEVLGDELQDRGEQLQQEDGMAWIEEMGAMEAGQMEEEENNGEGFEIEIEGVMIRII